MDLLLFQRQVIMWILCTKFFLIGKFRPFQPGPETWQKGREILFAGADFLFQ